MNNPRRSRHWPALCLLALSLLAATAPAGGSSPPPLAHRLIPISGTLGLADLVVEDPDSILRSAAATLNLRTPEGGTIDVPLRLTRGGGEWRARVMAGPAAADGMAQITYSLAFTNAEETWTDGPFTASADPPPHLRTPDWAKGAIWYQVFPERFRNGNPANDPRGPDVFPTPWTGDWVALDPDELDAARARAMASPLPRRLPPTRTGGQRYNVLADRRYGGDLQGVVEKLDELADLGMTAIYLNPVFDAHSLHKYDASDFRHIDPSLGAPGSREEHDRRTASETADPATWVWTDSDRYLLDVLLPEARKRGIRIVLDGVWSHVGLRFWAFRDVVQRGAASPYRDWFDARFAPEDGPELAEMRARHPSLDLRPGMLIGWQSWNGRNGTLPIFARTPEGRLHPEVEAHLFAITRRWMDPDGDGDPSDGIDGWRLDVVPDVPMPFWEAWRAHAKSINPDAVLIAEVWHDAAPYFGGRAFDAQMNYPFAMAATAWLGLRPEMTTPALAARLETVFSHAPQVDLAQMNLLTSHDTERLASMLANPGRDYSQGAKIAAGAGGYSTGRPDAAVFDRVLMGVALQATYPGAPMVYYGDEYGVHGADDPDCRKPLPWPDLGANANPGDIPDPAIRDGYREWLRLRSDPKLGPILRYGAVRHVQSGNPDVFAFERELNGDRVLVVLNRGDTGLPAPIQPAAADGPGIVPARTARWWFAPLNPADP